MLVAQLLLWEELLYEKIISAQLPVNIYLVVVPSCYIFINSYTEGYSMRG